MLKRASDADQSLGEYTFDVIGFVKTCYIYIYILFTKQ